MFRLKLVKDGTAIDFMSMHKVFVALSLGMAVLSIVLMMTRGLNFGIDFTGGLLMEVKTPAAVNIADVRRTLSSLSAGTPTIQEFGDNAIMIKIPGKEADQATQKQLYEEVKALLGTDVEYRRVEYVGPQVGRELIAVGVKAFVYSMIGILAYMWFRFEWQFGLATVVSLAHDVFATLLFFSVTQYEFDLSTVAAVLLVAGYSVNDTVIVFDRIREMLRKYRKMPLEEVFNLSVNQTLPRTIMTSMTTFLVMLVLLVFGAEAIKGFTYAMLIGILIGTYSSIFVAAPSLIYLGLRNNRPVAAGEGA